MGNDFSFEWEGRHFAIVGDELRISCAGARQATFPLAPLIDGATTTLGPWRQIAGDHFEAKLDRAGSVHLDILHGHVCYWMETDIVQFERLTFFPRATTSGKCWHTFTCDDTDRPWEVDRQTEIPVSSAYADLMSVDGADGRGMTDPGDSPQSWIWNVPVRACALGTSDGWLGLSIPGPVPVGVTRFTMDRRCFSVTFQVLRSTCGDWGMPVVYFVPGLPDAYDVLDEHRAISDRLGLMVDKSPDHPAWWANPAYEYWDEYLCFRRNVTEEADPTKKLTTEMCLSWLAEVKESVRTNNINVTFEQGCYRMYGDYHPLPELGGIEGLRKTIDALRQEGTRSAHYIHPYLVNTKLPIYREHPEIFCTPKDSDFRMSYGLEMSDLENPEFAPVDWTHPQGRAFILKWVEFIMSDAPGCLNCDILRSNHWRSPDPRLYDFHDPDWGIGDLMTMKVQKALHDRAKEIKPDCMVSKVAFADCYMQPCADMNLLCEEWNGHTTNWYRRGRIATRLLRDVIFCTDPYFVTMTKSYEYHMGMGAWNYPATSTVRHSVHPYTYYREFQEKAYRRRRAGFQAYLNAPFNATDRCHVSWDGDFATQWRKRTRGVLAGWFAAKAISQRCLVTYSETQAVVVASESRTARVPVPPGARVTGVEMVPHDGEPRPWDHRLAESAEGAEVEMFVEDCGKEAMCYRIRYELPG